MNEQMEMQINELQDEAIRTGVRAGDDAPMIGTGAATSGTGMFGSGGRSGYMGSGGG